MEHDSKSHLLMRKILLIDPRLNKDGGTKNDQNNDSKGDFTNLLL